MLVGSVAAVATAVARTTLGMDEIGDGGRSRYCERMQVAVVGLLWGRWIIELMLAVLIDVEANAVSD